MDFKEWLYNEMPINKWELKGNWNKPTPQYGYNRQDYGILTNPKAVEKIHRKWSNTQEDFDFYFIKTPNFRSHVESGQVTAEFIKQEFGLDIQPNPDAITVVFCNNVGAEKIPMTSWMIAHRLSHAVRRMPLWENYVTNEMDRDFVRILKQGYRITKRQSYYSSANDYGVELRSLFHAIGTMKSAQNKKLFRYAEFYHELLAQYINTGKVKFNPLPEFLVTRNRMAWGLPNPEGRRLDPNMADELNEELENMAEKYGYNFHDVLISFYGKIFLM